MKYLYSIASAITMLASRAYCFLSGIVSRVAEWFGRLLAKTDIALWQKSPPKIFAPKEVFSVKFDKVREFFSFLRVKQSWMTAN